jgi:hypothetical protein
MGTINPKRRVAILAAHGDACHYCGNPASDVDHIVAHAIGGTDDLGNLIPACTPCNMRKGGYRLPPDAERKALDAAEAARPRIEAAEAKPVRELRSAKVMVLFTPTEMKVMEDTMFAERGIPLSMSALVRTLVLEALTARGLL